MFDLLQQMEATKSAVPSSKPSFKACSPYHASANESAYQLAGLDKPRQTQRSFLVFQRMVIVHKTPIFWPWELSSPQRVLP